MTDSDRPNIVRTLCEDGTRKNKTERDRVRQRITMRTLLKTEKDRVRQTAIFPKDRNFTVADTAGTYAPFLHEGTDTELDSAGQSEDSAVQLKTAPRLLKTVQDSTGFWAQLPRQAATGHDRPRQATSVPQACSQFKEK